MCEYPIHYVEVENIYNQTLGAGYRTLAITSAKQGEGKTSLTEAIAKRAQFSNKNVLVVELNTFNPVLSENLRQFENEVIAKPIPLKDKGYNLIPAPKTIKEIMQYKETNVLKNAISSWLKDYDCIIFDTSALQSLNQSNIPPEIVCEVCDGAILIIEGGRTPSNLIEEGILKLKARKVNLIGTVINDKHNPSLLSEIVRETHRLDKIFPNTMAKLRKVLTSLVLLNVSV